LEPLALLHHVDLIELSIGLTEVDDSLDHSDDVQDRDGNNADPAGEGDRGMAPAEHGQPLIAGRHGSRSIRVELAASPPKRLRSLSCQKRASQRGMG